MKRGRLIKRDRRYEGETNIIPNNPGKVLVAMFQGAMSPDQRYVFNEIAGWIVGVFGLLIP